MNKQKSVEYSQQQAYEQLVEVFGKENICYHNMEYWAYPQTFSNTAGPFNYPGRISGQAFCTFTIEAWVHGKEAVLFCNNKLIKVIDNWDGPGSVRL